MIKTTKQIVTLHDAGELSIIGLLDSKISKAQQKHFDAFLHSGSNSYTALGHNLVALSRVRNRVLNALDLLDEDPDFV